MLKQERTTPVDDIEFVPLADIDEWEAWWAANGEYLDVDKRTAFNLACNCSLLVGGGAAPLFRIGFVD